MGPPGAYRALPALPRPSRCTCASTTERAATRSARRASAGPSRRSTGSSWTTSRNVLTEEVITDALKLLRRRLTDRVRGAGDEVEALEVEARRLRTEIANLVDALATGPAQPAPIVDAVAERQEKLSILDARIRTAKMAPEAISTELSRLEREPRRRLADFRTVLATHPTEARAFLARIFTGPLVFTPDGHRYRIESEIPAESVLFAGAPNYASPGGHSLW